MSDITLWHNPNCGTSRNVLAAIREAGNEPTVVPYLTAGWDRAELEQLLRDAGVTPRQALRVRGTPAEALGLLEDGVSDDAILAAMTQHPILVERPFVRTPKGAALARPAEKVRDLL